MRESFQSRFGFILAAAGSAVGLGNIWGFPTQVANHGGAAFLIVYLIVVVVLAIPALYSELLIGYAGKANPVTALSKLSQGRARYAGATMGYLNVFGALLMLSFYHIVAGWMLAYAVGFAAQGLGFTGIAQFCFESSVTRDLISTSIFLLLTTVVVYRGVQNGIELWSRRLMPMLFVLLLGLIILMAPLPGASEGFAAYLVPDLSQLGNDDIIVSAMGQAFFSLSIGLGGMMIYGSYLKSGAKLGRLCFSVAAIDTLIAFLAGLLIIPALYVALAQGLDIRSGDGLVSEGQLIFAVLPELFAKLGGLGSWIGCAFFVLLSIASLTSTIATAEVPVAYTLERHQLPRHHATALVGGIIALFALLLVLFFDPLFSLTVTWVTQFQLPLSGLFYFLVVGWLWRRGNQLTEHAQNSRIVSLLRIHIRWVCPLLLGWVFYYVALR